MNGSTQTGHDLEPQIIACADCGDDFTLTVEFQQRLMELFGPNYKAPKRCRPCREARKKDRNL